MEAEDTKGSLLSCVSWVPHPPPTGPGQEDGGEAPLLPPLLRLPPSAHVPTAPAPRRVHCARSSWR